MHSDAYIYQVGRREGSAKRHAHAPGPAVFYRVLCPALRIGNVIGKGGDIIQHLRTDTGARIKVEPLLPGCPERVIAILAPDRPGERWCDAQQALFRVHERITAPDLDGAQDSDSMIVRLLVDPTQVGCILGKGGGVITDLRRATGASIRVMSKQDVPACAERGDEVLQVSGDAVRVLDALQQVSARLRSCPTRQPIHLGRGSQGSQPGRHIAITASASAFSPAASAAPVCRDGAGGAAPAQGGHADRDPGGPTPSASDELPPHLLGASVSRVEIEYRVLVPDLLIGSIIGRGGEVVRRIRTETVARVKVFEARAGGCTDRVVVVTSADNGAEPMCAAQEALQRVGMCLMEAGSLPPAASELRLLLPAAQARALGGRDGGRLAALACEAGAAARLEALGARERPSAANPGDEIAALEGAPVAVMEVLRKLSQMLRIWQARTAAAHAASPPARGGSPASARSSPASGLETPARRVTSVPLHGAHASPHSSARPPSQGRPLPRSSLAGRCTDGHGGGSMAAATATLVLTPAQVGCILGRGGVNITHIRQISGAHVRLSEARPGVAERILEMGGALEQVQSAQSLVQGFLLGGGAIGR
ncbi:hypothetical protein WJX81_000504 [Elliptochloris bilobata]|uniref:K Homology domain-containing protein n=1 Tax=Elliptochloris bilobata TaxID=381761 RepID=A0AAW1QJH3_9CHLO